MANLFDLCPFIESQHYISCTPWSMRGPTPADVVKAKPVCGWARQVPMPRNIEAKSGIPEGGKFETQQN